MSESYPGPPPNAAHDPGLQPQYPQLDPWAAPYPPPNPYGWSPMPPGYGAPQPPPGERRPGTLTAAAVLAYVLAGLLVVGAMVLFTGATVLSTVDSVSNSVDLHGYTTELTLDGLVNLTAAGLLVAGGVTTTMRRPTGRVLLSAGAGIVLVQVVYWLSRWNSILDGPPTFYGLLFGALAVVGTALAWLGDGSRWLRREPLPAPPAGAYGPPPGYQPPGY